MSRLLTLCAMALATFGCSDKQVGDASGCSGNSTCAPGEVCVSGGCQRLCTADAQCDSGQICGGSTCQPGQRNTPTITSVDGDGELLCPGASGTHCIAAGLVVQGTNLLGATFTLEAIGATALELLARNTSDATTAYLDLPSDIADATYTLSATNQSGSANQAFTIIQGPQGPAGPDKTPDELVDAINLATHSIAVGVLPVGNGASQVASGAHTHAAEALTSGTVQLARLPVGTSDGTVAAGDHGHAQYLPLAGGSLTGNLGIGVASPTARLEVAGEMISEGLYQVGTAAPTPYTLSSRRYVVDAPPATVGIVVAVDWSIMSELCRDLDGCNVTIAMINWAGDGNITSRQERLFLSTTSNRWRFTNIDLEAVDANSVMNEWQPWDCSFNDAESYTGTPNGRSDNVLGWGLLNVAGGGNSDVNTTCRVVIED